MLAGNLQFFQGFTLCLAGSSRNENAAGILADAFEFSSRFIRNSSSDQLFEFRRRIIVIRVGQRVADDSPGNSEGGAKFCFAEAVPQGTEEVSDVVDVGRNESSERKSDNSKFSS